ncbi:MAG TPA: sugar transferase [Mycobacteriales bacterium]|nr:sugar transferase [Mycobacteriales bacterium]
MSVATILGSGGGTLTAGRAGSGRRWLRLYSVRLVALDVLAGVFAAVAAYVLRFSDPGLVSGGLTVASPAHAGPGYLWYSMALPGLWVGAVAMSRAYEGRFLGIGSEEFQRVFRAFVGLTATVGFASYATKAEVARGYVVLALPLAASLSLVGRYVVRRRLHRARRSGQYMLDVIAVGGEFTVGDLVTQLRSEPHAGMRVVGACLPPDASGDLLAPLGVPVLGDVDEVGRVARAAGVDTVAVTSCPEMSGARLRRLAWELEGTDIELVVAPGLIEVAGPRLHIRPVSGMSLLHVEEPELVGGRRLVKGAVDRAAGLLLLVLLSPVLLSIAAAVRLTSTGPAFFRQTRIGKDGREFTMVKFRTMVADAEARRAALVEHNERSEGLLFKIKNDPRVTPLGRVLRKYSLDELPQLINVLTGSMSLVGPRPPLPEEVALYEDDVRRRLLVRPGVTGLWQISGRSDLTWDESVRLDLRYVENWSLTLDLMILWKTVFTVLRGAGAY